MPPIPTRRRACGSLAALAAAASLPRAAFAAAPATGPVLLNVSYDVTREFYKDFNAMFVARWKAQTGESLTINQSHGGSSKQARSVSDGLEADVVTMNQANDIDLLVDRGGLLAADWATRLPDHASPTTSVSVILVRQGNPKKLHEWADLARPGVSVIVPNPKTSGNGRYTWLAAYGSVLQAGGSAADALEQARRLFANVPVLDGGGRAATTTFAQRGIGDALVTFESEVPLIRGEFGAGFDAVYPRRTVLAENPVAVVDKFADRHGTRKVAEAYLKALWSPEGQEIAARHGLRPRDPRVLAAHAAEFPAVTTFTVDEVFGGWRKAQKVHFDDGGLYDQALAAGKR